jgi:hypothetical protein
MRPPFFLLKSNRIQHRDLPEPNARVQHRSELSALGGDVCGASGDLDLAKCWIFRIPQSASAAKRNSVYFSKNTSS